MFREKSGKGVVGLPICSILILDPAAHNPRERVLQDI